MTSGCKAHRYHYPKPLTLEEHHVLPQAWQNFALNAERLFDKRTIMLCPTCHRNVHYWIVQLMHGLAPVVARPSSERVIAELALFRWEAAGRSLADLRAHKLWGNA